MQPILTGLADTSASPITPANTDTLKNRLETLAEHLRTVHLPTSTADRFADAAQNLDSDDSPWLHANLYEVLDPHLILEQIKADFSSDSGSKRTTLTINALEFLRNTLTVVPIGITWYALSQAVSAYAATIAANPSLSSIPFLVHWEQGFNGRINPIWTLGHVAFVDFWLLAAIVVLTALIHWRHDVVDSVQLRRVAELSAEFDDVLWQLTKHFYRRRFRLRQDFESRTYKLTESVQAYVDSLKGTVTEFQKAAREEERRIRLLTDERRKDLEDLRAFSENLQNAIGQLDTFRLVVSTLLEPMGQSAKTLSEGTAKLSRAQNELVGTLNAYNDQLGSLATGIQDYGSSLGSAAAQVSESNRSAMEHVARLTTQLADQNERQAHLVQLIDSANGNNAHQAEAARAASTQLVAASQELSRVAASLPAVSKDVADAAQINQEIPELLRNLLNETRSTRDILTADTEHVRKVVNQGIVTGISETVVKLERIEKTLSGLLQAIGPLNPHLPLSPVAGSTSEEGRRANAESRDLAPVWADPFKPVK